MNERLACALEYHALGIVVLPILAGTKRPAVRWTELRTTPPAESDLVRWFARGDLQPAILCGEPSGGLVVRDFDTRASYERWRSEHSLLAKILPTARTARGAHVYCRTDAAAVLAAGNGQSRILRFADGELKADGYVLAPPAVHPSGIAYEWLIPPGRTIHVRDLDRTGFVSHEIAERGPSGPRRIRPAVDAVERDAGEWKRAFGLT